MPRASDRLAIAVAIALAAVAAEGCRRGPQVVPVSGVVEVDGKPLTTGAITVIPDQGRAASATIGKDGRFTLTTFLPGDGALLGRHRVVVTAHQDLGRMKLKWLVPAACRDIASTPLVLEVTGSTGDAQVSISTDGKPLEVQDMSSSAGDISPQGVVQP
jgi:hypothetical protein